MSEKQSVKGTVTSASYQDNSPLARIEILVNGELERFWWPYEIPEGTPVVVTVEIGKRERKGGKGK